MEKIKLRPRIKKSRKKRLYDKDLNQFKFTYPKNYDGKVYEFNENRLTINPIPVIVELRHNEGYTKDKLKINAIRHRINRDIRKAQFQFRHADAFKITQLMSPMALLLGIRYGLKKLEERLSNE